ncbi:Lactoylglutathione lyase [Grifola frondosa]|uniref:Lactoylglutathione lyase n=1 Tax=Grifola frondosa TaxID=5627 RepID=A0A1C7M1D1_GRIFR|nr:Lactoylglutathione lyase [Grifola frondosa]
MPQSVETAGFQFNHTMIRVKEPQRSIRFYTEILGMDLLSHHSFDTFTLYFLGYDHLGGTLSAKAKKDSRFNREGVLELTHNHGTESDPNFSGYASGNADPGKGFGHIAITVPDVDAACARFEKLGVVFKKKPTDGRMREIAFILDPDGYWIEIVPPILTLGPGDEIRGVGRHRAATRRPAASAPRSPHAGCAWDATQQYRAEARAPNLNATVPLVPAQSRQCDPFYCRALCIGTYNLSKGTDTTCEVANCGSPSLLFGVCLCFRWQSGDVDYDRLKRSQLRIRGVSVRKASARTGKGWSCPYDRRSGRCGGVRADALFTIAAVLSKFNEYEPTSGSLSYSASDNDAKKAALTRPLVSDACSYWHSGEGVCEFTAGISR